MKSYPFLPVIALTFLTGCGLLGNEEALLPEKKPVQNTTPFQSTEVAVRPLRIPDGTDITDIEIILEAPPEPIDGFVIKYGQDSSQLDQERTITISQLEKAASQNGATRYRHVLRGVPNNQKIFLTVTSFRGGEHSEPSAIIEVK